MNDWFNEWMHECMNEWMNEWMGFYTTFMLNWTRRTSWEWWDDCRHGFEIMAVWGRAHYFSITEASHNIESLCVSREETFCFFETWMPERGLNPRPPTFQAGSFNHCTRAPATAIINLKSDVNRRQILTYNQQTQNICITSIQRQSNVFDFGPTLYKWHTNVLCLLGTYGPRTEKVIWA